MDPKNNNKIAVLGASKNPSRYSNKLIRRLISMGREVYPIHPAHDKIEGKQVFASVSELPKGIDVLSLYVNPGRSHDLAEEILNSDIPVFIFNPGAENPELEKKLKDSGKEVVQACSLVLSGTGNL